MLPCFELDIPPPNHNPISMINQNAIHLTKNLLFAQVAIHNLAIGLKVWAGVFPGLPGAARSWTCNI